MMIRNNNNDNDSIENENENDNDNEDNNNDKDDNIIIDLVIIGLMNLLSTIIENNPNIKKNDYFNNLDFVDFLFKDFLFALPKTEKIGIIAPPVCKTKQSRKAAFSLLKLIVSDDKTKYNHLVRLIYKIHLNNDIRYDEWNYSPGAEQRSSVGFIGIKNLGCVCYMISLIQQLFMMPKFRRGILALNEPEDTKDEPLEDNLIYQLQIMFANMQESYRQYFDPTDFCKAFKDYDGQPTDVSLQMDVDEYFNMLCDKVEMGLKKTKQENLLKEIWCGKICSQLICQECKTNSERAEDFYTVSLDLKNKQSIIEALEFYVQGEMLTGSNAYFCEKCDKKVDALMRRCIKTLPSTLILHMKRFEFNFDTMRKLKLNDYCEFPMNLNMKPYTTEGIQEKEELEEKELQEKENNEKDNNNNDDTTSDNNNNNSDDNTNNENKEENNNEEEPKYIIQPDDYYNYELAGILVHRGVADSGHYYSFIKLRNSNGEPNWIDFNDELVRTFNINSIEKECFGGTEQIGEGHFSRQINRTRNAYMLIYERKDAYSDCKENPNDIITEDSKDIKTDNNNNSNSNSNSNSQLIISQKPEEDFYVKMPKKLYDSVWNDNMKFMLDKKLFDKDYASFCADLVSYISVEKQCDNYKTYPSDSSEKPIVQILILYFLNILIHSKETKIIEQFANNLIKHVITCSVPASLWFLSICSKQKLKSWLLECTQHEPRQAVVNIISNAINVILPFEIDCILDDNDETSICKDVINNMLALMKFLPWYWRNIREFFIIFENFALSCTEAREYLENNSFILHTGRLITIGKVEPNLNAPKMGDKFDSPDFSRALSVISILIRSSFGIEEEDEEDEIDDDSINPFAIEGEKIEIMESEIQFLFSETCLKKIMNDNRNVDALTEIICFLSYNSPSHTEFYERFIKTGINDAEYDQIKTWFDLLRPVIDINDSIKTHRIEYFITSILHITDKFKKYPKFTREIISGLFSLYETIDDCKQWLDTHRTRWVWIEKWVTTRGIHIAGLNAGKSMTSQTAFKRATPQQVFRDHP